MKDKEDAKTKDFEKFVKLSIFMLSIVTLADNILARVITMTSKNF